jgi:hypothetical protein
MKEAGKGARLPNKLSALLRVAVEDSKKLARRKGFKLNMSTWVRMEASGQCAVCMAGAVMVSRFGVPVGDMIEPCDLSEVRARQMLAINSMRVGQFAAAHYSLRLPPLKGGQRSALRSCEQLVTCREIAFYERADWRTYTKCAGLLEEVGL